MKKFKKKNNKGFSLVELIVVIAIMAVLMGVLAPTLIGNIEKSRESKDLQNLDSIRQAVVAAMAVEGVYAAAVPASGSADNAYTVSGTTLSGAPASLQSAFGDIITGDTKMTCAAANGKQLKVKIGSNGAVKVGVYETDGTTVVTAPRNNIAMESK